MNMFKFSIVMIFVFFVINTSYSEENKVVYVDIEKIMNQSNAGKQISKELSSLHKKKLANFKKKEEKLKKEEANIIAQKKILTKKEFEKKILQLRKEVNEFRQERNIAQNDLTKKRLDATSKLLSFLNPILSEYSSKNNIALIIQKKNIVIGKATLDITKDILEIVNKNIKKVEIKD